MGLSKQYMRYEPCGLTNVVGSTRAGLVLLNPGPPGGGAARGGGSVAPRGQLLCAMGACELVNIWNLRKAEKVCQRVKE
jgi:hypothetical protein